MILLVDHQDSFTRNLEHMLADLDRVEVIDRKKISDRQIKEAKNTCHFSSKDTFLTNYA